MSTPAPGYYEERKHDDVDQARYESRARKHRERNEGKRTTKIKRLAREIRDISKSGPRKEAFTRAKK